MIKLRKSDWRLRIIWLILALVILLLLADRFFQSPVLFSPGEDEFNIYFWIIILGLILGLVFVSMLIVRSSIRRRELKLKKEYRKNG